MLDVLGHVEQPRQRFFGTAELSMGSYCFRWTDTAYTSVWPEKIGPPIVLARNVVEICRCAPSVSSLLVGQPPERLDRLVIPEHIQERRIREQPRVHVSGKSLGLIGP